MKKISLILMSIIVLISCNSNENIQNTIQEKSVTKEINIPKISTNSSIGKINFPNKSIIERIDKSTIKITLPKNYFLAESINGRFEYYSEATYKCTCSGANGCDVFYVQGNYGCNHGNCTGTCTGKFVDNKGNKGTYRALVKSNLFIINKNKPLEPATSKEFKKLKYMPSKLVVNLNNDFKKYAKKLYGNNYLKAIKHVDKSNVNKSNINNIMLVTMKMYGYKFIYSISVNHLKPDLFQSNKFKTFTNEGVKHSCKCTSGNKGCTKDSSWGVKYCKGGTYTECEMTVH